MIVFELVCTCGCIFEGWFKDRNDFERQIRQDLLICPTCSNGDVRKILSPISYQSFGNVPSDRNIQTEDTGEIIESGVVKALETLQRYVEKNFEDVGSNLAKESLKIHYGVVESRNIMGVVTEAEEKQLDREGIKLLKIPFVRKDCQVN